MSSYNSYNPARLNYSKCSKCPKKIIPNIDINNSNTQVNLYTFAIKTHKRKTIFQNVELNEFNSSVGVSPPLNRFI